MISRVYLDDKITLLYRTFQRIESSRYRIFQRDDESKWQTNILTVCSPVLHLLRILPRIIEGSLKVSMIIIATLGPHTVVLWNLWINASHCSLNIKKPSFSLANRRSRLESGSRLNAGDGIAWNQGVANRSIPLSDFDIVITFGECRPALIVNASSIWTTKILR